MLFWVLFLFVPLFAQDTTGVGSLSGTVLGVDGKPAIGVKVCIQNTDRCATTDITGSYRLVELRSGDYPLEITAPGQPSIKSSTVQVRAGLEGKVDVSLPRLESVTTTLDVVESSFIAPEEVKNSGYLVQGNEVFKVAGALQDVSRYVQLLPGVAIGSDDFRNDIIVRGGSPLENLFVVDNIEVPNINTFANFASAGGSISILDPAMLQDVTFLTGGYPAPYINRTSSVLQITQREGDRSEFRGRATLGFAGAGALLEGPINKGKGSWMLSARRSFLDFFTDDVGFGGVPVVYTFNAKAVYDLTPKDRIWGVALSSVDEIRLGAKEPKEGETLEPDEINNLDIRYDGWRLATGFNWQRLFGERSVGLLGITHSESRVNQQVKDLVRNGVPPPGTPIDEQIEDAPIVFKENSREGETTMKYDYTTYMGALSKIQAGGSFKIFNIDYNTASPYGNDSPFSPTPGLDPFILRTSLRTYQNGAYVQTSQQITKRLNVTLGGRLDDFRYIGSTRFSPRAGASFRITDKLSIRASYGWFFQQPSFLFVAAYPINQGVIPIRAEHFVAGLSYVVNPTLRFTVETYRKSYNDYPVSIDLPTVTLANIGDTFNVRDILFQLTSAGRGDVMGVELFVEKKFTDKWFGQANFSWSQTRHAGLDEVKRPGAFDYTTIFNVVGGYRLTKKWELSTRVSHLTGRPFTPYDIATSTAQRRGVYDLNQVNAERLPDYFRWDIRADRTFYWRDDPILVFVGFQNVINRKNIAGYTWNRATNTQETNEQLGIFPLIGLEWRF